MSLTLWFAGIVVIATVYALINASCSSHRWLPFSHCVDEAHDGLPTVR